MISSHCQSILKRLTLKIVYIVPKLDHLTCSKCLFMTLNYNMYNPLTLFPIYSQYCVRPTCQMV